ncbi:hypothetical protein TNCV_4238111 [Trichonephila clavipes]|nr:hypothetical protein TNCV_4238111 [Trichonephila clavipes]
MCLRLRGDALWHDYILRGLWNGHSYLTSRTVGQPGAEYGETVQSNHYSFHFSHIASHSITKYIIGHPKTTLDTDRYGVSGQATATIALSVLQVYGFIDDIKVLKLSQ